MNHRDCFASLTRNNVVPRTRYVKRLPRRKAGAYPSSARQADRWVPACAGKALWSRFHPGRVGRPAGAQLAMTPQMAVIARSGATKQSRREAR
jgi:hypothetical protein